MAEEKQKSLGIVIKNAKTKKQKEEKKLYTIVSCCVSAIFLITILVPLLSKGEDKASSGMAYKSVAFDLADLAVDDEAERVLLEMQRYSDIPQQKIAGGLFDKKQKEERQELDKKEGIPAAPDNEYKEARQAKKRAQAKTRGVQRSPSYYSGKTTTTTNPGRLNTSSSGLSTGGGGASSATGTTWTSADKQGQKGTYAKNNNTLSTQQQIATAKDAIRGRVSGLMRTMQESQDAAKNENAEGAMQGASDAFTDPNIKAEGEEEENDAAQLMADAFDAKEFKKALNDPELADLQNKINEEKERQEQEKDPCLIPANKMSWECYWSQALLDLGKQVLQTGLNLLQSYGQAAINAQFNTNNTAGTNPTPTTPAPDVVPDPSAQQG